MLFRSYADAEEVELFLNGHSLGKKPAGEQNEFTATYELVYEPGELIAVSYEAGIETGRYSLNTASEKIQLCAEAHPFPSWRPYGDAPDCSQKNVSGLSPRPGSARLLQRLLPARPQDTDLPKSIQNSVRTKGSV